MSIKCGNPKHEGIDIRHETVADVRACFASPNGVADFAPTTEGVRFPQAPVLADRVEDEIWPWAEPTKPAKPEPIYHNPFTQVGAAYVEVLKRRNGEPSPAAVADLENGPEYGPIDRASILAKPPIDSLLNSGASSCSGRSQVMATPAQISFVKILLAEREVTGLNITEFQERTSHEVLAGYDVPMTDARDLITALKALPKRKVETAPQDRPEQPWRKLSREVPAGNYCLEIDGKNHFYRVSVGANGYYKLQERASDELFFIPLSRYATILQAILEVGVEASRLRYARELSRCWHCHRTLTDNTGNPHFSRGLGPYCGDEH